MRAGTKGMRNALVFEITNSGFDRRRCATSTTSTRSACSTARRPDDAWFAYVCALDEDDNPLEDESLLGEGEPAAGRHDHGALSARARPGGARHAGAGLDGAAPQLLRVGRRREPGDRARRVGRGAKPTSSTPSSPASSPWARSTSRACEISPRWRLWWPGEIAHLAVEFWTPKDTLRERAKRDAVPYDLWVKQGHITATPGRAIDYRWVAVRLGELQHETGLRRVAFDPYRIKYLEKRARRGGRRARAGAARPGLLQGGGVGPLDAALDRGLREALGTKDAREAEPGAHLRRSVGRARGGPQGEPVYTKRKSKGRIDGIVARRWRLGSADDPGEARDPRPTTCRRGVVQCTASRCLQFAAPLAILAEARGPGRRGYYADDAGDALFNVAAAARPGDLMFAGAGSFSTSVCAARGRPGRSGSPRSSRSASRSAAGRLMFLAATGTTRAAGPFDDFWYGPSRARPTCRRRARQRRHRDAARGALRVHQRDRAGPGEGPAQDVPARGRRRPRGVTDHPVVKLLRQPTRNMTASTGSSACRRTSCCAATASARSAPTSAAASRAAAVEAQQRARRGDARRVAALPRARPETGTEKIYVEGEVLHLRGLSLDGPARPVARSTRCAKAWARASRRSAMRRPSSRTTPGRVCGSSTRQLQGREAAEGLARRRSRRRSAAATASRRCSPSTASRSTSSTRSTTPTCSSSSCAS
jgi:hypothetical protein